MAVIQIKLFVWFSCSTYCLHTCTRNDGLAVHGQEDPRDDEVYPEQENRADRGPQRLTVKPLPKVITVTIGTTVKTSVKTTVTTTVTTTKGTPGTRVMPCYNKTHRLKQQR